ncbi:MAG TPA: AraC family transcriptional regulator [Chitinophagaceae bacterium]|nr:AraC family transcriptional regulator [Chitinophagaceae bacterium]
MKAQFHMIPAMLQGSYTVKHEIKKAFDPTWHYHPELELHYVIRGHGKRFIGNNIDNFSDGELLFIGENVPHTWKCDQDYFSSKSLKNVEAIVIQFRKDFLGDVFLDLPESHLIPQLFEKAKEGMVIHGKAKSQLKNLMKQSLNAEGLDRIIHMLSILKILATNKDFTPISFPGKFNLSKDTFAKQRLDRVYKYTITNYMEDITLDDISSISNLSTTSFCRYFKAMTKMTYYDFLTKIRIKHACKLLIDDSHPTNIICYECGFNNISNFYRHFKRITGLTPKEYQRSYLKGIN